MSDESGCVLTSMLMIKASPKMAAIKCHMISLRITGIQMTIKKDINQHLYTYTRHMRCC